MPLEAKTVNTRVTPTTDLDKARHDLDVVGYCIVEDLAPTNLVDRVRDRVLEQASAERDAGQAFVQDGNTQWVANVLNKGEVFLELLTCSATSLDLCRHVLGDGFILSCSNAPIAGPATGRMKMHSDQYWTPTIQEEPLAYSRLGENGLDRAEVGHSAVRRDYLFPPCMVTLVWAITDFTADNGATVFVPGSHMSGLQPDYRHDFSDAVPAEMPAGSIVLWDGRTWHATGANRTQNQYRVGVTNNMVAPMIRPLVNYPYSLRAEVVERLDERQKQLLGFTTWTAYGNEGVPMQDLEYFKPAADQPGAMR